LEALPHGSVWVSLIIAISSRRRQQQDGLNVVVVALLKMRQSVGVRGPGVGGSLASNGRVIGLIHDDLLFVKAEME